MLVGDLDALVAPVALYPDERPLFMSFDDDRPVANVTTALTGEFEWATALLFDLGVFLLVVGGFVVRLGGGLLGWW